MPYSEPLLKTGVIAGAPSKSTSWLGASLPSSPSIFRYREFVAGVSDPLLQARDHLFVLGMVAAQLREIHFLVWIIVQIELEPGAVLEAHIFPTIAPHQTA